MYPCLYSVLAESAESDATSAYGRTNFVFLLRYGFGYLDFAGSRNREYINDAIHVELSILTNSFKSFP
jgi:hypothetical protein